MKKDILARLLAEIDDLRGSGCEEDSWEDGMADFLLDAVNEIVSLRNEKRLHREKEPFYHLVKDLVL